MKTTISDFVIAFFDLLEAEGRTLKNNTEKTIENIQRSVINSSVSLLGVIIAGFIFVIAFFALGAGLFLWMNTFFSPYISAFILSIVFFVTGFVLLWIIKQKNERNRN